MKVNEIEKQLEQKSKKEINTLVTDLVFKIRQFKDEKTGSEGSGLSWYQKHTDPKGSAFPDDPWSHHDWSNLRKLFTRSLQKSLLEDMVCAKTKELLKKMDLLV
jgi:hypothetical protein